MIKTFIVSPGSSGSVSISDYTNFSKLTKDSLLICPYNIVGTDGYSLNTNVSIGSITSYNSSTGLISFTYKLSSNNNSFVTRLFAVYCVSN